MSPILEVSTEKTRLHFPTIRRLPNGLTVIAEQMPIDAVNLSLWLKVGSAAEPDAINGVAHFLEHMIFKGTPRIPSGEFERLVEERGAVTNAATSQDYTHFYITGAPQDFATLAPIHIDLVMNPCIDGQDFERERPVILEEIRRSRSNPNRRNFQRSMEMAFEQLPYRRQVLGPEAVIQQLTPATMRAFHRYWYQPQNITAVAVGNLPVNDLVAIVAEGFEQAIAHRSQLQSQQTEAPARDASTFGLPHSPEPLSEQPFQDIYRIHHTDASLQQACLQLTWRVPGLTQLEQTYALDVVASILGHGRTARLVRDLRENRQWVSGVGANNLTYDRQGIFSISARLEVEHLSDVEAAIVAHIQTLASEGVTDDELRRVQTQVANRYIFGSEAPSDRAGLYGYYQTMTGNLEHALNYPAEIQALTVDDLQGAVQRFLPSNAYGVMTICPET
ncbi:MAG: pitrilysin family protein [Cyanobacteria bacterium P01_C01_bin.73]